jgi:Salmonella virulence plasmid 65kDa B protein
VLRGHLLLAVLLVLQGRSGTAWADTPPASVPLPAVPPTPLFWPNEAPLKGAFAGALPGGGEVSPTGEYTYSLPIDLPPGRAGMQPSLALVYAHRAGNGLLGEGFSLDFAPNGQAPPRASLTTTP